MRTLESLPEGATHWSTRGMAKASGVSAASVGRIWRAFGLQPHRSESFKLSTDPDFVAKVRDIVGLYMAPPIRAVVLCVDEKSQIQALDRSQPLFGVTPRGWTHRPLSRKVSPMPRTRPPHAPEFRRQMVELVRTGRDPADLARAFEP